MDVFDHKELKLRAKRILRNRGEQIRKITWIYCGVAAGITLLVDLLSFLLFHSTTSGSIITFYYGKRFDTADFLLSFTSSMFIALWNAGYIHLSLGLLRGQAVSEQSLTEGFRLFWPIIRVTLLWDLILFGLSLAVIFISMLFSLSALLFYAVLLAGFGYILYMSYRLGFAVYITLESPQIGTVQALSYSRRFTEENCWNLFRLDLSFWWYFALSVLVALVGSLPLLLELWEVNIGLSPLVSFFLSSTLCALGSFLLNVKFFPYLALSRAGAFLFLRDDYLSQEQLWY